MLHSSDIFEDFAIWAFGKNAWNKFCIFEIDEIDLINFWNSRHGDDLTLDPDDPLLDEILAEMEYLYKEHCEKKSKKKIRSSKANDVDN